MKKRYIWKYDFLGVFLFTFMLVMGCSNSSNIVSRTNGPGENPIVKEISTKSVTITAGIEGLSVDSQLKELIHSNLQRKHPNITLQIYEPGQGTTLNELIIAGQTPDLIFTFNGNILSYRDKNLLYDITQLMKEQNISLSQFQPNIIRDMNIASTNNEIFGLPYNLAFHGLYYNKDIFEKFGVDYPPDGMDWDQILELTVRLTRVDGGIQYRGLDGNLIWISQPLSAAAVDPFTEKASVNTDSWRKVFDMVKKMQTIPGNEPTKAGMDAFLKDKNLAMILQLNILSALEKPTVEEGFNWDMAQYPTYPERPNTYGNSSVQMLLLTQTSKNKDQAMQVIAVAASEELQMESSRQGRVTPLQNKEIQQAFGTGVDYLKGKNLQSVYKSKPVQYPVSSQYRTKAEGIVVAKFNAFRDNQIDVNTALKQAEEEINAMIEAERQK